MNWDTWYTWPTVLSVGNTRRFAINFSWQMPVRCQLLWKPKDSVVFYIRHEVTLKSQRSGFLNLDPALPIFIHFYYESEQVKNPLDFFFCKMVAMTLTSQGFCNLMKEAVPGRYWTHQREMTFCNTLLRQLKIENFKSSLQSAHLKLISVCVSECVFNSSFLSKTAKLGL